MRFSTVLGLGVSAALILIVYHALAIIIAGLTVIFYYALAVGSLILLYIGVMVWRQKETERLRAVDGQYALQRGRLEDGTPVLVDMNKSISGITILHKHNGPVELPPAAGWQLQGEYVAKIQTTRSLAAITPGDNAMIKTHGAIQQPRLPANITKLLPGFGPDERRPSTPAPLPLPALPAPADAHVPITGQQMIASTNPQPTRLTIGEDIVTNNLVQVDLALYPFLKLHGASGTGKTNLARLLVAQALRRGYEVDIYDTRQFKDWGLFAQHVRLIDSRDPKVLVAGLQEEVQRYKERDAELSRHGVPDLAALTMATGKAYRRRLIVIEEMGTQTLNARDEGKDVFVAYIRALRAVTVNARATGIHGIYLDQVPAQWDSTVRYNTTMVCFYLPDHGGKVAGYPAACNLPQYHAYFEGKIIRTTGLTDEQIRQAIDKVPPLTPAPVRAPVRDDTGGRSLLNTPTNTPTNTNTENTPNTPSEWAIFAEKFFTGNPMASQRALTRAMAAAVNDGRPAEAFLGGLSSELFHRWSPRGTSYQPPITQG